jgi:hypothetical protein
MRQSFERFRRISQTVKKGWLVLGLKQDDFRIPQEKLDDLNRAIEQAVLEYFACNPEADPLDSMSVTFNLVFGFGRDLDVHIAGKTISVDLD